MTGDAAKILDLWREMVGDPAHEPEELSGVWAVQLGAHTEPLNLEWFGRKHGSISRVGEVVVHPTIDWAAATLDAWSDVHACPIEAKHVRGFEPLDTIIDRYQPQIHWQMMVTGAGQCALSVIMGAREPAIEFIGLDRRLRGRTDPARRVVHGVRAFPHPADLPRACPRAREAGEDLRLRRQQRMGERRS